MDLLRKEFKYYDAQSSGKIGTNDFKRVLAKYGVTNGSSTIVQKFGANGKVNYSDFLQFFENSTKKIDPQKKTDFPSYDSSVYKSGPITLPPNSTKKLSKDKQQRISKDIVGSYSNAAQGLFKRKNILHKFFKALDSNSTGTVSKDQFENVLKTCGLSDVAPILLEQSLVSSDQKLVDYEAFLTSINDVSILDTESSQKKNKESLKTTLYANETVNEADWKNSVAKRAVGRIPNMYSMLNELDPMQTGLLKPSLFAKVVSELNVATEWSIPLALKEYNTIEGLVDYQRFLKDIVDRNSSLSIPSDYEQPSKLEGLYVQDSIVTRKKKKYEAGATHLNLFEAEPSTKPQPHEAQEVQVPQPVIKEESQEHSLVIEKQEAVQSTPNVVTHENSHSVSNISEVAYNPIMHSIDSAKSKEFEQAIQKFKNNRLFAKSAKKNPAATVYRLLDSERSGSIESGDFSEKLRKLNIGLNKNDCNIITENIVNEEGKVTFDSFLSAFEMSSLGAPDVPTVFNSSLTVPHIAKRTASQPFYVQKVVQGLRDHHSNSHIKSLLHQLDNSQGVPITQFKAALDASGISVTPDEYKAFVEYCDTKKDGMIDYKEMKNILLDSDRIVARASLNNMSAVLGQPSDTPVSDSQLQKVPSIDISYSSDDEQTNKHTDFETFINTHAAPAPSHHITSTSMFDRMTFGLKDKESKAKSLLQELDSNKNGLVNISDFKQVMGKFGINFKKEEIEKLSFHFGGGNNALRYEKVMELFNHGQTKTKAEKTVDERKSEFILKNIKKELLNAAQNCGTKIKEVFFAFDKEKTKSLSPLKFRQAIKSLDKNIPEWVVERSIRISQNQGSINYEKFLVQLGIETPTTLMPTVTQEPVKKSLTSSKDNVLAFPTESHDSSSRVQPTTSPLRFRARPQDSQDMLKHAETQQGESNSSFLQSKKRLTIADHDVLTHNLTPSSLSTITGLRFSSTPKNNNSPILQLDDTPVTPSANQKRRIIPPPAKDAPLFDNKKRVPIHDSLSGLHTLPSPTTKRSVSAFPPASHSGEKESKTKQISLHNDVVTALAKKFTSVASMYKSLEGKAGVSIKSTQDALATLNVTTSKHDLRRLFNKVDAEEKISFNDFARLVGDSPVQKSFSKVSSSKHSSQEVSSPLLTTRFSSPYRNRDSLNLSWC